VRQASNEIVMALLEVHVEIGADAAEAQFAEVR
jgi:hypothetical protein